MDYKSNKPQQLAGTITVPGDKSITHRALILAALANGTSCIKNASHGEDCVATKKVLQQLGVTIKTDNSTIEVIGVGKYGLKPSATALDCGNSGTLMRVFAGVLAAQDFFSTLVGDKSLSTRPMQRIIEPLMLMGANIKAANMMAPLQITGSNLHGISYQLPIASAQVKSCLLLAGMYASGETTVIESQVSRDHTENMLQLFQYPLKKNDNHITITNQHQLIATNVDVVGDISAAAFFMVAAAIAANSEVVIKNVGVNPTRDGIIQILQLMGADIEILNHRLQANEKVADIKIKSSKLKGIVIPSSLVPIAIDEFPIIFIAAAVAAGKTSLTGAKELRTKESDRLYAMEQGLKKLGINITTTEDGVEIEGGKLQGGEVKSFGDHRIAMAFAVAAVTASAPIHINDCDNVATSFPNFTAIASELGMNIQVIT